MTNQPRLFARTREQHKDIKQLSSENFVIVLLDVYTDDIRLRQELYGLSNCHYFRTMTINNCLDLIIEGDAKDALMILIVSNRFVDFVRHNLLKVVPQLSHVYLFDNVLPNQRCSSDRRFHGAFDNVQSLVMKIYDDIDKARQPKNVSEGIQFVLEDSAQFFWYRFFFNVLDHLQHTEIAKRELFSRFGDYYQETEYRSRMIDKFEQDYRSERAIWWYTYTIDVHVPLNRALRCHDINEIFSWRACIQDLDKSLQQLWLKRELFARLILYRGQGLHSSDLNKLKENVGKLVTMTSFLSTTMVREVAMMFAASASDHSELQGALFTINIDSNDTRAIFADIRDLSCYPDEEEVLFSLRSMFRINRVEFVDNVWQIDLTAVDEDDQEFSAAINPWKTTISEQSFFSGRDEQLFTRYLNVENSSFLAFQLLIDFMLRLDQTDFARQEMIEMCRLKYARSPVDLKKITEFEQTYSRQDAAKWYTTDSFLYRLLNDSLRLEDIDALIKLRYYIYDLHNQLAELQILYIESLPNNEPILTLYRGQRMNVIELKKLRENVGQLISKNSFLSTTSNVQAAVFFSGDDSLDNSITEVSVLYQITVDTSESHSIPFAKIDYLSVYEDEDEILFSMASVFRIDRVEQYGSLWVADLTLINKEDENWNTLTAHLNN